MAWDHMTAKSRWDDDAGIEQLRTLWAEGHSTSEIARRIGVTKNAIVGKAHRLDLPGRPSPIRRGEYVSPPIRRVMGPTLPPLPSVAAVEIVAPVVAQEAPKISLRLKEVIAMKLPKPTPKPVASIGVKEWRQRSEIAVPAPEPATTFIARSGKCQWTDSEAWPWFFCGDATDGGSWCACHRRIVFVRASAGIRVAEGKTMGPYREMPTAGRWAAE